MALGTATPWRAENLGRPARVFLDSLGPVRTLNMDYRPTRDSESVKIPAIGNRSVTDGSGSNTLHNSATLNPASEVLTIDRWRQVDVMSLTDAEVTNIAPEIVTANITQAVQVLAQDIQKDILGQLYTSAYGAVNVTTSDDTYAETSESWREALRFLSDSQVPAMSRYAALPPLAEKALRGVEGLVAADTRGDAGAIRQYALGSVYGVTMYAMPAAPTLTARTGNNKLINKSGGHAIGVTTVTVDGNGVYVPGSVIYFGTSNAQRYVMKAGAVAGATSVSLDRGLEKAVADDDALTPVTGKVGYMYHRDALAVAFRNPAAMYGAQVMQTVVQDPQSGISFRVVGERQHNQTYVYVDSLYGRQRLRKNGAVAIVTN